MTGDHQHSLPLPALGIEQKKTMNSRRNELTCLETRTRTEKEKEKEPSKQTDASPRVILVLLVLLGVHELDDVGIAGAGHVRDGVGDALLDAAAEGASTAAAAAAAASTTASAAARERAAAGLVVVVERPVRAAKDAGELVAQEAQQRRHAAAHDGHVALDHAVGGHVDVVVCCGVASMKRCLPRRSVWRALRDKKVRDLILLPRGLRGDLQVGLLVVE